MSVFSKGLVEEPLLGSKRRDPPTRASLPHIEDAPVLLNPSLVERLESVRRYLHEHLAEPVSIAALSELAALSPSYLARAFKSHVGVPPHQYLVRLRLERAQRLLESSDLSVGQIAHRVGFGTPSHFITRFRAATGLTPFRYRWAVLLNAFSEADPSALVTARWG